MRLLSLLILILTLWPAAAARSVLDNLPARSPRLDGYREDSVRERMATAPLHEIEGLWEMAGEGSLMAVERYGSGRPQLYVIAMVTATDAALRPGTVMGWLTPGAAAGTFDCRLYTSRTDEGTTLSKSESFSCRLADDGESLIIKPYGLKLRFNWWRLLLPYMYRGLVSPMERSKGDIDGLRRVYPRKTPLNPRYL
ncbi:MAG: hypothetical protein NC339_01185 [Muribaculaceae bacterium]|nr:hypothetical protein [Muribaculaceae bacterium]